MTFSGGTRSRTWVASFGEKNHTVRPCPQRNQCTQKWALRKGAEFAGKRLLAGDLHLLMLRMLAAPRAELAVFYLALHQLAVLAGIVITPGTDRAFQAD